VDVEARLRALRAYATHAFTATGAVFAFLALLAAVESRWAEMFGWLVVAFIVDGVDGALARRTDVVNNAPIIDGALLDLVIDFLTYVFIPVFALLRAGLLTGPSGLAAAAVVVFASSLYFADTRMKTPDKSFSGFPAAWNMFALVVFATELSPRIMLPVVAVLTVAMFVQVKFVHPVRTVRWRPVSLPVAIAWTVIAGWAALSDFAIPSWAAALLLASSLYLATAGSVQQLLDGRVQRMAQVAR
jgi:phosphatidylcholine synthase